MTVKKRNKQEKLREKAWKNVNEAKFEKMVSEYHAAKELLATMEKDSPEYVKHQKHCDSLFASAEKFFNQNQ